MEFSGEQITARYSLLDLCMQNWVRTARWIDKLKIFNRRRCVLLGASDGFFNHLRRDATAGDLRNRANVEINLSRH